MQTLLIVWVAFALIVGILFSGLILKLCARIVGLNLPFKRACMIVILSALLGAVLGAILGAILHLILLSIFPSKSENSHVVSILVSWGVGFFAFAWVLKTKAPASWGKALGVVALNYFIAVILSLGVALPLRIYVVEAFKIPSKSMAPTLTPGDHVFVEKFDRHPKRGEVIAFFEPGRGKSIFISRVMGLPGETIEIHDGAVWANGAKLEEATGVQGPTEAMNMTTMRLGSDQYFLLGDNRGNSFDSRFYGPVPAESIVGKYWLTWAHFPRPDENP